MARAGRSLRTATGYRSSRPFTFGPCGRPLFEWPFPKANSIRRTPRASLRDRVSKTQSAWGSTKVACQFFWDRGRQAMHLSCKQAYAGALPADSTNFKFLRETRLKHREKPHKLLQVGVIPTPATNFSECSSVFRVPGGAGGNPAIPTNSLLSGIIVVRPLVKRNGAGASPA
jgi:hypothetical protein